MYAIVGLLINLNYISSETRLPPGRLAGQGGLVGIPSAAPLNFVADGGKGQSGGWKDLSRNTLNKGCYLP